MAGLEKSIFPALITSHTSALLSPTDMALRQSGADWTEVFKELKSSHTLLLI